MWIETRNVIKYIQDKLDIYYEMENKTEIQQAEEDIWNHILEFVQDEETKIDNIFEIAMKIKNNDDSFNENVEMIRSLIEAINVAVNSINSMLTLNKYFVDRTCLYQLSVMIIANANVIKNTVLKLDCTSYED